MIFVDTSAFHALLDADDQCHPVARGIWEGLLNEGRELFTSNYIVVETCALLQRRLGMEAVRVFRDEMLPVVRVEWIDARRHEDGLIAMMAANRRKLSLVDCVSFEMMRARRAVEAFTFDGHFAEQGFVCRT
jgi:uncharacterized protein